MQSVNYDINYDKWIKRSYLTIQHKMCCNTFCKVILCIKLTVILFWHWDVPVTNQKCNKWSDLFQKIIFNGELLLTSIKNFVDVNRQYFAQASYWLILNLKWCQEIVENVGDVVFHFFWLDEILKWFSK